MSSRDRGNAACRRRGESCAWWPAKGYAPSGAGTSLLRQRAGERAGGRIGGVSSLIYHPQAASGDVGRSLSTGTRIARSTAGDSAERTSAPDRPRVARIPASPARARRLDLSERPVGIRLRRKGALVLAGGGEVVPHDPGPLLPRD